MKHCRLDVNTKNMEMVFSSAHDWMEMNYSLLSSPSETNQHLIRSHEYSHHPHPNQALPNNLHQKGLFFHDKLLDLNVILRLHLSISAIMMIQPYVFPSSIDSSQASPTHSRSGSVPMSGVTFMTASGFTARLVSNSFSTTVVAELLFFLLKSFEMLSESC